MAGHLPVDRADPVPGAPAADVPADLTPVERELLADLFAIVSEHADEVAESVDRSRVVQAFVFACEHHADGMDDELLARLAALVGVVVAGERERPDDVRAVDRLGDLVGVLLDDREQVREQLALEPRQLARNVPGRLVRVGRAVDGRVRRHGDVGLRRAARDLRACGAVGRIQAAARAMWLLRYVRPSSRRRR